MSQNLISISFTPEQTAQLDATLAQLEATLAALVSLDVDTRRQLFKMGDKSEAFCRQALSALDQNRQLVPPSMGLDEALSDLAALDVVRPFKQRLERLLERLRDTEMALGSDIMAAAVEGYSLLKVMGKQQGLDGLRKDLGARFARRTSQPAEPVPES